MRAVVVAMVLLALAGCGGRHKEQVAVVDVTISSLNMGPSTVLEQTWNLTLRIQNPNNYDIPADGMKFGIEVNGRPFAKGVDNQAYLIPRLGEATVQVKAISDLPALIQQFGDLRRIGASGIDYYLQGRVYSGEWHYPFEYYGAITPVM
jgi:LEA14-like dessication related protein